MTPKFLICHRFVSSRLLEHEGEVIMLNPRRVDYFEPVPPPTQQPGLYSGTKIALGSKTFVVVSETMAEIKRALKK